MMTTKQARKYKPAFSPSDGSLQLGKGTRTSILNPDRLRIEHNRVFPSESAILIDNQVYFVGTVKSADLTKAVSNWDYEQSREANKETLAARKFYAEMSGKEENSNFWEKV